jgi:hypothetical protein
MPPSRLENLVTTRQLKEERPAQAEFDGLLHSGSTRLKDAKNTALSDESRFDLACNAAHSLALAALRFAATEPIAATLFSRSCPTPSA